MNEQQFQNKTSHEVLHQASFPTNESMQKTWGKTKPKF